MTWPIPLSAIGRRAPGRPGGHLIGKPPLPKLSSQRTLRWRGVDSNHQFRESRHRCPHVDFSVEAAELVDLVGDWALTFAAASCDLVHCRADRGDMTRRAPSFARVFTGRWRITEMYEWDEIDLAGSAHITLSGKGNLRRRSRSRRVLRLARWRCL